CLTLNVIPTNETYTHALHDALPIYLDHHSFGNGNGVSWITFVNKQRRFAKTSARGENVLNEFFSVVCVIVHFHFSFHHLIIVRRSEEHTSELQSRENLVCRLLLVK